MNSSISPFERSTQDLMFFFFKKTYQQETLGKNIFAEAFILLNPSWEINIVLIPSEAHCED